jgi:hypothetical protein
MQFFKTLSAASVLSKGKCRVLTKNLEKLFLLNGEWIVFYSMNSVQSLEFISLTYSKKHQIS